MQAYAFARQFTFDLIDSRYLPLSIIIPIYFNPFVYTNTQFCFQYIYINEYGSAHQSPFRAQYNNTKIDEPNHIRSIRRLWCLYIACKKNVADKCAGQSKNSIRAKWPNICFFLRAHHRVFFVCFAISVSSAFFAVDSITCRRKRKKKEKKTQYLCMEESNSINYMTSIAFIFCTKTKRFTVFLHANRAAHHLDFSHHDIQRNRKK